MTGNSKSNRKLFSREPRTQPSLFHYVKETEESSAFKDTDWSFLRHPIKSIAESRKETREKASLFHYVEEEQNNIREVREKVPFTWKRFFKDFIAGFKNPVFIPSVFSDFAGLAQERSEGRTRKIESSVLSIGIHIAIVCAIIFIMAYKPKPTTPQEENVVVVNNQMELPPVESDGRDGGGGGGGGKLEQAPAATGRMPDTQRVQLVPPDPSSPKPLMPADELLSQVASVQMPIDIPQNQALPIGDISLPPNGSLSSGSGRGGGIGTGTGTGVGSGTGAGVGPGSGGGMGGGSGGGIGSGTGPGIYNVGNGVTKPVGLVQPLPAYTEEGRKARAEGIVLIKAVIRKDGTVDSPTIIRGLGFGLDDSAIYTITNKWKFKPGTKNGTPVDVWANIEVAFRLY